MFLKDLSKREMERLGNSYDKSEEDGFMCIASDLYVSWFSYDAEPYVPRTQKHGSNGALRASAYVPAKG